MNAETVLEFLFGVFCAIWLIAGVAQMVSMCRKEDSDEER